MEADLKGIECAEDIERDKRKKKTCEQRCSNFSAEPSDDGRIYSILGVKQLPATGAVYVFTMGIYDASARRSNTALDIDAVGHRPERAWTVAISVEGQGTSTDVAVPFVKTLVNEVLWPAIQEWAP